MKMHTLIEWFQLNYPEHKRALLQCNHNFDDKDLNPYHLESDCWSHTMMVCKIAELYQYAKVVRIAAILHDIGKPKARKVNLKNNHIQFFGHEQISAELSNDILQQMIREKIIERDEAQEIQELIKQHSLLHKVHDEDTLLNLYKNKKETYIHLVELNRCDTLGRFCEDNNSNDLEHERLLSYAKNM